MEKSWGLEKNKGELGGEKEKERERKRGEGRKERKKGEREGEEGKEGRRVREIQYPLLDHIGDHVSVSLRHISTINLNNQISHLKIRLVGWHTYQ